MTQPSATGPVQPAARSIADLHARFLDSATTTAATTVTVADRVTITMDPQVAGLLALLCLAGLFHLWTTGRDWFVQLVTTLKGRREG